MSRMLKNNNPSQKWLIYIAACCEIQELEDRVWTWKAELYTIFWHRRQYDSGPYEHT
jgi:hypothetical protein